MDTDPHFIIHVPQKEDTLCFNINEEPGVVLSLVQDPNTGTVTSTLCQTGQGWAPLLSTLSCGQDSSHGLYFLHLVYLSPGSPQLASFSPHLPVWATQGLLHGQVTQAGAQDPRFRRAPGSV